LVAGGSSTRFLSEAHSRVGRWLRNKWHLDSLIAIGGMAAVYASTHRNGARAAIKLLHSQYTRNEQARRRFLAEGYAANKVGHRNAVLVLDDDTTEDGEVYLVMELLEGESLEGRLERLGVMSPIEVLAIADQLLEVLGCAHPKGILHRDIKPANIYLTRDGSVKLLDFGLARVRELSAEALDQSDGIVFGTVSYIAPEQARADNQNLDSRSDMWSIAATMFRALAGETVHPSTGPIIERLLAVARKPPRSLASLAPNLPRPVIELVDRALAFDPEDRWPSVNVMRVVVQDVMAQLQEEAAENEVDIDIQQSGVSRRNNTPPVHTRAQAVELATVRPGHGPGSVEPGPPRPKTDPVGLSTRPRNLPPSSPASPDGDETELDLEGLYEKAEAAGRGRGRSRTLLTKEGRAELRRILDARKAAAASPDAEPIDEPRPRRRLDGPDTSGVDIEVQFDDSLIEVTIAHTQTHRPGPIAERISEPSSASPVPAAVEAAPAHAPSLSPSAEESAPALDAAGSLASYPAIAVEDEDDEVMVSEAEVSKAPSNLRPPSVPPQQPVTSDRRAPASSSRTLTPHSQALIDTTRGMSRPAPPEITRVGPPPRPTQSDVTRAVRPDAAGKLGVHPESRPSAAAGAAESRAPAVAAGAADSRAAGAADSRAPAPAASTREITKVGPAPVAPPAPPSRESSRLTPRPNSGLMHETMRTGSPVAPPVRGPKDESRPAPGVNSGLLNETLRPGAAPPPVQARGGPPPASRAEGEPARSTGFTAPARPGGAAEARPAPEASTSVRSTNFTPPPGRPVARPSTSPEDPSRTSSTSGGGATAGSISSRLPRPNSGPNTMASPAATNASASKDVASAVAPMGPVPTRPSPVAMTPAASPIAASPAAGKPVASPIAASPAAGKPVASSIAASPAASKPVASSIVASPAASPAASPIAASPAASKPAASPAAVASNPGASNIVASQSAASTSPVAGAPTSQPVVPAAPGMTGTRTPVPVMTAPTVAAAPPAAAPDCAGDVPVVAPEPEPTPTPVRSGKSMFNPYPSLGGARPEGAATVKTASYATLGGAGPKDSSVASPTPRTSPNAKTAPHAAAEPAVPKDSPGTAGPQDSSSGPTAKTAAYATVGADEAKRGEAGRSQGKTTAPVLPFSFLRPAAKPGEPGESKPPEDPNRPGRKKP
jgi:serine/threonine protein kinase